MIDTEKCREIMSTLDNINEMLEGVKESLVDMSSSDEEHYEEAPIEESTTYTQNYLIK